MKVQCGLDDKTEAPTNANKKDLEGHEGLRRGERYGEESWVMLPLALPVLHRSSRRHDIRLVLRYQS